MVRFQLLKPHHSFVYILYMEVSKNKVTVSHENSSVRPPISLYNGHVQIVCAEPQDGYVSVSHRRRPITQFKYDRSAGNTVKCQRPQCDLTF